MRNNCSDTFLNPVIELRNVNIRAREISTSTAKSETNNAGDLTIADQATTRITKTSVTRTVQDASTHVALWDESLIRLRSVAEARAYHIQLYPEQDRVWSGVCFLSYSPES